MVNYKKKFMTIAERDAFVKLRKYIQEKNEKKALFWLDRILLYWHTPKEFGRNLNQLFEAIKTITKIDSEITKTFTEKIRKLVK